MTPETAKLTAIALNNSSALNPNLYPLGGVKWVQDNIKTIPYNKPEKIDGVTLTFRDAGHILGSASAEFRESSKGEVIVFSGDLGNSPSRTVKPISPPQEASIAVIETTYGDREHSGEDPIDVLKECIDIIKKTKGTLLIPAFAIDRTQLMIILLKQLKKSGHLGNIPVFLDSPMGIDVTKIYEASLDQLNEDLQDEKSPFRFSNLNMTYLPQESRSIRDYHGAKIVIAGSGMMSGGRIERHALDYLPDANTVILFVGYPAEGTPSREIVEGEKSVQLNGKTVNIKAQAFRLSSVSAHADQEQLINWLGNLNSGQLPLRIAILVHGNESSRNGFTQKVLEMGVKVSRPQNGEIIDLTHNPKS
jgi:metallo-beta-lactamase family protein